MADPFENTGIPAEISRRSLFAPHRLALTAVWLLATVALFTMLLKGARHTGRFQVERYVLHVAYVAALLWHLVHTGSSVQQLPDVHPLMMPRRRLGRLIPVAGLLLLLMVAFTDGGLGILLLVLMASTVWILVAWRREVRLRRAVLGLSVAAIALLGGLPIWKNHLLGESAFWVLLVFVAPMFVAGGLITSRTGLGGSQLYSGRYIRALKGFLVGCLLFVPLGLMNAASGSPGTGITWVTRWWMPFSLPLFSGIVEEAWYRLFLVGLGYLLLRPACGGRPAVAVVCAAVISAITFGLGHGGGLAERLMTTGLLYGLPTAVMFVRRDWEHAVGAHYMVNVIPWMLVYLES